ncbi:MAG: ATP-binding protein [Bacteroidales bacterium]
MTLQEEVSKIIGKPKSSTLEYKAVLPPSKSIAQILCSFANTDGGILILGVSEIGGIKVSGLSGDFKATPITHKAIDLLSPKPIVDYSYVEHNGKNLFAIRVEKSDITVSVEGKIFKRVNTNIVLSNPTTNIFQPGGYSRISTIDTTFDALKTSSTDSKTKLLEHYQSVLKIIDDLKPLLYPENPNKPTNSKEGKVLSRILYSSIVDNFETYLSDILLEIYLAKPETLKSEQTVKVEEVLNCSDLQDFIMYWAKQKIGKLQKGSVKGFISENKQIRDLKVIDNVKQDEIEKILQIRHLYSHRNGIVDDKFLKYFSGFAPGAEHQIAIDEILNQIEYLTHVIDEIDKAAIAKYNLSTI